MNPAPEPESQSPTSLRTHSIVLRDQELVLRPMTEADWDILLKWNNDPDVLYYAEFEAVTSHALSAVQAIYRWVSQNAFCFVMEVSGQPIGECWLQHMNLDRIKQKYPRADCRRIDLMIGEKARWGQGYGTRAIQLLVRFAFQQENADFVFGCEIADYNLRSQKAFQKVGFSLDAAIAQPSGAKMRTCFDYVLSKSNLNA